MGSGAPREVFEVAREVFEVARAVDEVVGHPMSHTARIANGTMSSASSVSRTYDVMSRRARPPDVSRQKTIHKIQVSARAIG